jgi:hypothetical protein
MGFAGYSSAPGRNDQAAREREREEEINRRNRAVDPATSPNAGSRSVSGGGGAGYPRARPGPPSPTASRGLPTPTRAMSSNASDVNTGLRLNPASTGYRTLQEHYLHLSITVENDQIPFLSLKRKRNPKTDLPRRTHKIDLQVHHSTSSADPLLTDHLQPNPNHLLPVQPTPNPPHKPRATQTTQTTD